MKRIIKLLGLGVLVLTQISLSSASAAVTATTYNDGDILFSNDFENTSASNMTFSGGTFPIVSVMGHTNTNSSCMEVSVINASRGIGKSANFTFPSAVVSDLSPSYIEISGWAKASNVTAVTGTNGYASASVKINNRNNAALKYFLLDGQWEQFVMLVPVPLPPKLNATRTVNAVNLYLGLWQASGTVWFDDLQIKLVKKIPTDTTGYYYAGAYPQCYTGHPGNPVVNDTAQADTYFRGMHYTDAFFSSQTPQESFEVLGGKMNANIFRWMLDGPSGKGNIDMNYGLSYDSGPVTINSTTYKYGTYWDILEDALGRLDEALKYAQQYGLKVVVNLNDLSRGLFDSQANQDKFVKVWQYIANRYSPTGPYSQYSDTIYGYDLANEPFVNGWGWQEWSGAPGVLVWDDLAEKTAKAINAIDSNKTIIVEPWLTSLWGFVSQVPINASNVVYSPHMYDPGFFTMQTGNTGMAGSFDWPYVDNSTNPPTTYNKTNLSNLLLNTVENFSTTYNAHIYIGEFGASRWAGFTAAVPPAEKTAAYNYTKDCIEIFEANKWDWTFFGFRTGGGGWSSEHDDKINTWSKGFFSSSLEAKPNSREQLLRMYFAKNQNPYTLSNASLPLTSLTINSIHNYANFYAGYSDTSSPSVKLKLSGALPIDEVNSLTGYYVSNNNATPSASTIWNNMSVSNFFFDNSINHTLSGGNGLKTVYAWFKDTTGAVFGPVTDTINLNTSLAGKIKPVVTITEPTTMDNYTTTQPFPSLRCIIVDDVALASFNPTYTINNGQPRNLTSAKINSTDPEDPNEWYAKSGPVLTPGINTIIVTAKDSDNNTASDTINITYNPILINIINPTSEVTYTTANSTLDIGGIASDKNGVINKVEWSNDEGMSYSSVSFTNVNGNIAWSVPGISLVSGNNDIRVRATDNAGNTATDSLSVTYSSSSVSAPTATTNQATNIASDSATLNGLVNPKGANTTVRFDYGTTPGNYTGQINANPNSIPASSGDTSVGANLNGLPSSTTYYYRVVATNSVGTTNGNEMSFTTDPSLDASAPSGSISRGGKYTKLRNIPLTLSATDNIGVTGYYLSENDTTPLAQDPGWILINPATTTYSAYVFYLLSAGDGVKTIYAWYKDAAGNISSAASATIILDTTAPSIIITSPTANATYTTTSSTIDLGGTVSDTTSGIRSVSWSNDRGGSGTATISATDLWSVSGIALTQGDNLITLTALDMVGAIASATITVTYNLPDTAAPNGSISINNGFAITATTAATLSLSASDNVGITGYYLSTNPSTPSATANGWVAVTSASNYSANIPYTLNSGDGLKTVYCWYQDASGNVSSVASGSITLDTTAPTVTISSPTAGSTVSGTISVSATAYDINTVMGVQFKLDGVNIGIEDTASPYSVSWDTTTVTKGSHSLTAVARDSVGNTNTSSAVIVTVNNATNPAAPTVATGHATSVTKTSATLNGSVNPNGLGTAVWFEYGTVSGSYSKQTTRQELRGSSVKEIRIQIKGLSIGRTYYYRIVAKNPQGTSYGEQSQFPNLRDFR